MGAVYQAQDMLGGEQVAVKVIHGDAPDLIQRLLREARTLAEIDHPGIVRYLSHGLTAAGQPFLVMEWLTGEDLARRLRNGPLTVRQTLERAGQASRALAAAHRRGIVHRDIKPQNLFLLAPAQAGTVEVPPEALLSSWRRPATPGDDDGAGLRIKILDFGIAHLRATTGITSTGAIIGPPAYMAPEQPAGKKELDARAERYSLGCV